MKSTIRSLHVLSVGMFLVVCMLARVQQPLLLAAPTENSLTIEVDVAGAGVVDLEPNLPAYAYGQVVTLTAAADPGWSFVGWQGDLAPTNAWWRMEWAYRVPITVNASGHVRTDKPVEAALNFTALLAALGDSRVLDLNSIRVVEVTGTGSLVDAAVPFQFDKDTAYNATNNASGVLVFIMQGNTPADAVRFYHVYFDVLGETFPPSTITPRVSVTDSVVDEGQESFKIDTPNAAYYFHKLGAGFSSVVDRDGNDWVGWRTTVGAEGSYRGIPNLVHPEGHFHPRARSSTSRLVHEGPIKATIRAITNDGKWEALWEIYPTYAKMTVLKIDHDYWFLYEGTPGGKLDIDNDFVVRSDGNQTPAAVAWEGDLVGEEWVYLGDPDLGRALFFAHHEDDAIYDSYYHLAGAMTVFGFGRRLNDLTSYLNQAPAHFTLGFIEETGFSAAAQLIRSAYKDLVVSVGTPERQIAPALDQNNPMILTVIGNHRLSASFTQDEYTLSVNVVGQGDVQVNPDRPFYRYDDTVLLVATPVTGWRFDGWLGDVTGASPVTATIIRGNMEVIAAFVAEQYTLTLETEGGGRVVAQPDKAQYAYGDVVQLTAVANDGWRFVGWGGALSGDALQQELAITEDLLVTATFAPERKSTFLPLILSGR